MPFVRTSIAAFLVALIPAAANAEQGDVDPLNQLQEIRDTFRRGDYESVVRASERLLEDDPSMLVRAESLQYLGASLELLGRTEEAEDAFETLVNLQPQWAINRSEFPTEVIGLYEATRDRVEDQLNRIDEQRRRAQAEQRRDRERQMQERQERLISLARPRYLVREETRRGHLIVAFLPFGAGQFQNDQRAKGYAFLGVQLGLTVASMALWLTGNVPNAGIDGELFDNLRFASYGVSGALTVSVVWGVIDAVVTFLRLRRRPSRWTEVDERQVPPDQRVRIDPSEWALDDPQRTDEPAASDQTR